MLFSMNWIFILCFKNPKAGTFLGFINIFFDEIVGVDPWNNLRIYE